MTNLSKTILAIFVGSGVIVVSCIGMGYSIWTRMTKGDIEEADRELPAAIKSYKDAGFYWTQKDIPSYPGFRESGNALPLFREALKEADWAAAAKKGVFSPKKPMDHGKVQATLKPYEKSMATITQASLKPYLDFHRDYDEGFSLLLPEYQESKTIVQAFCSRAQMRALMKNPSGAEADLTTAFRLSKLVGQQPFILSLLCSIALKRRTLRSLEFCAAQEESNPLNLKKLQSLLNSTKETYDFDRDIRTECYMEIAVLRNVPPDAIVAETEDKPVDGDEPDVKHSELVREGVPKDRASCAYLTRLLQLSARFSPILKQDQDRPVVELGEISNLVKAAENQRGLSYSLGKDLYLDYSKIPEAITTMDSEETLEKALLEALVMRAKTGKFPTKIDEFPTRWIDPFTGRPIKIKQTKSEYRIYSVGPDRKDDGGLTKKEVGTNKSFDLVVSYPPIWPKTVTQPN